MNISYEDSEKLAFGILLGTGCLTPREMHELFDIKESTARSWKGELSNNPNELLLTIKGKGKAKSKHIVLITKPVH